MKTLKDYEYYRDDSGVLYLGDCLEIMPLFEDNSVDLIVTSPPYDNLREYDNYSFNFDYCAFEIYRIMVNGGIVVWVVGDSTVNGSETGSSFKQVLYFKNIGFNLHDTMIYEKNSSPYPDKLRYNSTFEYMFILSKGKPKTINLIQDRINNWFSYEHPAMFPELLAKDHIISWSNNRDIVLDPLAGSGTTLKMAKLLGRKWIGIEISKKYCDIIVKRMGQEVLFK